jgi:hypothetical protein
VAFRVWGLRRIGPVIRGICWPPWIHGASLQTLPDPQFQSQNLGARSPSVVLVDSGQPTEHAPELKLGERGHEQFRHTDKHP